MSDSKDQPQETTAKAADTAARQYFGPGAPAAAGIVSSANTQKKEPPTAKDKEQNTLDQLEQAADDGNYQPVGQVTSVTAEDATDDDFGLPLARVREGETVRQTRERLRRAGRGAGMTRKQAIAYADAETDRLHPWEPPKTEEPAPPESRESRHDVVFENVKPASDKGLANSGVRGLQDIPADWGSLPNNASLQAEVAWVQAERLRIVEETSSGATVVHLDRASVPAPSMASLSWVETSIRSYAKWCDIAAKATATQADEAELVRRERVSIEEMRGLLAEMVGAETCPTCGRAM